MTDNLKDCPPGYYCPEGSELPLKCNVGTYNNEYNAKSPSDCKSCLPGQYCDGQALIEPTGECEQGYFCTTSATSNTPDTLDLQNRFGPCPAGFYCPPGSPYPIPCPQGTYSNIPKSTSIDACNLCDAGMYCSATAITAPEGNCDAGFYCPIGSVTARP